MKEILITKTIHFDNSEMARSVYGNTDENLIVIEHDFSVELVARDLVLKIKGKKEAVDRAFRLFEALRDFVRSGRVLNKYELRNIVDSLGSPAGKQDEALGELKIAVPSRRRFVFPKTPNQKKYIEAIASHDIVFGIGPAGTGKCVAGNTLVLTDRGAMRIKDLAGNLLTGSYAPVDLTVAGLNGPEQASHVYCGGRSYTKIFHTRLGFEIETTPEHPLLRLDEDGTPRWISAENLRVGNFVAIQRGTELFGNDTKIDFSYQPNSHRDHSKPIQLKRLDTDFAYLLGILTGDGCLTFKNRVILSSADPETVAHFKICAGRLGLHIFRNGADRPYDWIVASSQFYQLLLHLGMSNGKAHSKHIPRSILRAPREIVIAYLQGLFDSDGTVSRRDGYPQFFSMSKQLVEETQILLLNLGILAIQRDKHVWYQDEKRLSHYLEITGAEADLFFDKVGFRLARKQNLRLYLDRNTNVDVLPNVSGLVQDAVFAGYSLANHAAGPVAWQPIPSSPAPIPPWDPCGLRAVMGARHAPPAASRVNRPADRHFFWAEILEIGSGETDVYDLTVPGTHSFCANGFVNHNTYLAMAMAVSALHQNKVGRIILVRPAVEAGESLGFLPGDMLEKVNPYLRPLYDALYDMMDVDKIQRYMERGVIEVAPLAFMRGRTLNDSFIIMDEAQNSTMEQMKMFLTRLGYDSKAVITGDVTQVDLPINKGSGLVHVQDVLHGIPGIKFFNFNDRDVVRHELVRRIIRAYERKAEQVSRAKDKLHNV